MKNIRRTVLMLLTVATMATVGCSDKDTAQDNTSGEKGRLAKTLEGSLTEWVLHGETVKTELFLEYGGYPCTKKYIWDGDRLLKIEGYDDEDNPTQYCEIVYNDGQPSQFNVYKANGEVRRSYTLEYDADGHWAGAADGDSEYSMTYNNNGELTSLHHHDDKEDWSDYYEWSQGNIIKTIDGDGETYYSYDQYPSAYQGLPSCISLWLDDYFVSFLSKNNMTEKRDEDRDREWGYKYSNGVPIVRMRKWSETESNDTIISKYDIMYFEYTDGTGRINH